MTTEPIDPTALQLLAFEMSRVVPHITFQHALTIIATNRGFRSWDSLVAHVGRTA